MNIPASTTTVFIATYIGVLAASAYGQVALGAPPVTDVTVVNTAANPVPVSGSVGITNTPTVSVGNLGSVAAEPGKSPYQVISGFTPATVGSALCPSTFYCAYSVGPVPDGKRLVVTYVSVSFSLLGAATEASAGIGYDGNVFTELQLPAQPIGVQRFLSSGPVMYFVDAGHMPTIFIKGQQVAPSGHSANLGIVGYLVPLP